MWCIYREKNKGKKRKEKEVCNGHVTVARGRKGRSQRSYDRWGVGGAGWEGRGGNGGRNGGGGGGGGRKGGPGRSTTLGPSGPPLWARQASHSGPIGPVILSLFGPSSLGPFGPPSGPVRPVQYKVRGLVAGLKKIKFPARSGPLTGQRAYRPGPNRATGLT